MRADALHLKPPQIKHPVNTAAHGGVSRWLPFLMPSVSDLLFVALLLSLSCGAMGRLLLRDAGTGWHIRNGELMLQTHAITRIDPFSATMNGQPWYAWEWLYDVVIAAIHHCAWAEWRGVLHGSNYGDDVRFGVLSGHAQGWQSSDYAFYDCAVLGGLCRAFSGAPSRFELAVYSDLVRVVGLGGLYDLNRMAWKKIGGFFCCPF